MASNLLRPAPKEIGWERRVESSMQGNDCEGSMHGGHFAGINVHGCGLLNEVNTDHDTMLSRLPHELAPEAHQRSPDHFDP